MYSSRLLAIDPSLTCSGWALFFIESGQLAGVGKIRSVPARFPLAERLYDLHQKINEILESAKLSGNDVLICEAPTTMRDPHAAIKVEQVRSMFETLARERRVLVPGRLNPRSVQREIMGLKGKQIKRELVKEVAAQVVHSLYSPSLRALGFPCELSSLSKHQDIVDAILIGSLGLTRICAANRAGVTLAEFFDHEHESRRISARWKRTAAA